MNTIITIIGGLICISSPSTPEVCVQTNDSISEIVRGEEMWGTCPANQPPCQFTPANNSNYWARKHPVEVKELEDRWKNGDPHVHHHQGYPK